MENMPQPNQLRDLLTPHQQEMLDRVRQAFVPQPTPVPIRAPVNE